MSLSKVLKDKKYLYIAGGVAVGAGFLYAIKKHKEEEEEKRLKNPHTQREATFLDGVKAVGSVFLIFGALLFLGGRKSKPSTSEAGTIVSIEIGSTRSKISFISRTYNLQNDENFDYKVNSTHEIDTVAPQQTIERLLEHVQGWSLKEIGLSCFTPVCLDPKDPNYGCITSGTPKLQWQNYPLLATIKKRTGCENVFIDTNANAAAIAEYRQGDHNVKSLAYANIGSEVNVAVIIDGKPIHGLINLEGGHIRVSLDKSDESFEGTCPYHGNCLEGLVSKSAIAKRLGLVNVADPTVPDNSPVWEICANYLAQLCLDMTLVLSPEVIVLNGGLLSQPAMLPLIQKKFTQLLNNYVDHPKLKDVNTYINLLRAEYINIDISEIWDIFFLPDFRTKTMDPLFPL